ncbi:MAG: hypothetical protein LBT76_07450 [Tannerella sp.]|jgi:hypothetical protein|nr:hypothetical protein [Tannerella sp.]
MSFLKKLQHGYIWRRIFVERLTEPLHQNQLAIPVFLFGSYRARIAFDLILRQQHAFGLLKAADRASKSGLRAISVIEFGVASGAGLINIQRIAGRIAKITGIRFDIYGFDNVTGMPPHKDYRDHPDLYREGDYPMNYERLHGKLNPGVRIIQGNIRDRVKTFLEALSPEAPIGFVSVDVDYYSSTVDALTVFDGDPEKYADLVYLYFDDIHKEEHNHRCGELLAIDEFNLRHDKRVIEPHAFLASQRVFKQASWLKHIYFLHVLDHKRRNEAHAGQPRTLENPYL